MKKKTVAMVLCIALLMCIFPVPASASETGTYALTESYIAEALSVLSSMSSGRTFVIENRSSLKGFSGEDEYILLTFADKGYAIISMQTERIVEAMPDGVNPTSRVMVLCIMRVHSIICMRTQMVFYIL